MRSEAEYVWGQTLKRAIRMAGDYKVLKGGGFAARIHS